MKKLILGAALAVIPVAAWSDNALAQKEMQGPSKAAPKAVEKKASKAARLSDAELDKITAGDATQIHTGHGVTIILNPGNADVFDRHKHGLTCINCF